ncbi:MAG: divalent metal cation transporter [Caulobacteraceae bacterium]|nr:divalent metal cation transporter [Caulobacteraceae bacterium]
MSDSGTPAPGRKGLLNRLGPGLVTGAADDDPSGIATYSQAGAQHGLNLLWTVVFTYPLMVAIQLISARIGRVTGRGLAANLASVFPRPLVLGLVGLLFVANTINIGADVAAMGAAAGLVLGWGDKLFTVVFALASLLLQLYVPYHRYVSFLKWLTLALFAYVGVVFTVQIDWPAVLDHTVRPQFSFDAVTVTTIVAIFGTTISPYLFFWQASEEVEDMEVNREPDLLHDQARHAREELRRIRLDTFVGMGFSNLVAFFVILTAGVTLHAQGVTDIQTSADAARALKPIAGPLAFALFSLGIIGTGFLAAPVLAGSVGYAVAELRGWPSGLELKPGQAKGFYAVITAAMVLALAVVFSPLDPIKTLFWSAVLNGVISVPIMAAMMVVGSRRHEMGSFVATLPQRIFGWAATLVMAAAVAAMIWLSLAG